MTLIKISFCLFIFNCSAYCQINSVAYDLDYKLIFEKNQEALETIYKIDTQDFLDPSIFNFYYRILNL